MLMPFFSSLFFCIRFQFSLAIAIDIDISDTAIAIRIRCKISLNENNTTTMYHMPHVINNVAKSECKYTSPTKQAKQNKAKYFLNGTFLFFSFFKYKTEGQMYYILFSTPPRACEALLVLLLFPSIYWQLNESQ
jgi:hypothetical protein